MESGILHCVVPELPEDDPESLAVAVAATVANELVRLASLPPSVRDVEWATSLRR